MADSDSKSKLYELPDVAAAIAASRDFAERAGLGREDRVRLCIILEELVTNLFEHGEMPDGAAAELVLTGEADAVHILLSDPARPFDPRTAPEDGPPKERGGGAGIRIVRQWARIVSYETEEGRNRLELRLPLKRPLKPE